MKKNIAVCLYHLQINPSRDWLVLIFIAEGREFEEVTELTGRQKSLSSISDLSFNSSDNEKYTKMRKIQLKTHINTNYVL